MKDFIYHLIDFMWFWTPDNTRNASDDNIGFINFLFWAYIITISLPILVGTLFRLLVNSSIGLPTVTVNNKMYYFEGKLLKQLIAGSIIENILFWIVFNTFLLALPFILAVSFFIVVIGVRGVMLGEGKKGEHVRGTLTLKYLTTKLKREAQKNALNDMKKVQDDYLTIEKNFLNELTSYKNESGTNVLSTGVN